MSRIVEFEPSDPEVLVERVIKRVNSAINQKLAHSNGLVESAFAHDEPTITTLNRSKTTVVSANGAKDQPKSKNSFYRAISGFILILILIVVGFLILTSLQAKKF